MTYRTYSQPTLSVLDHYMLAVMKARPELVGLGVDTCVTQVRAYAVALYNATRELEAEALRRAEAEAKP